MSKLNEEFGGDLEAARARFRRLSDAALRFASAEVLNFLSVKMTYAQPGYCPPRAPRCKGATYCFHCVLAEIAAERENRNALRLRQQMTLVPQQQR